MAKKRIGFVDVDYLKGNTGIENNVDSDKLVPYIFKAQHTHLQQILGSSFYDHLSDAVYNSTLTTAEDDLIKDYIKPLVSEWTFYEVMPFLNFKMTNKAVSQENSEFSTPSTVEDIKFLRNSVRDLAEFYSERLTTYLCDNQSDFPAYTSPTQPENLPKNTKTYFGGVYIPKKKGISGIRSYDEPDSCEDC